eukprot:UN1083
MESASVNCSTLTHAKTRARRQTARIHDMRTSGNPDDLSHPSNLGLGSSSKCNLCNLLEGQSICHALLPHVRPLERVVAHAVAPVCTPIPVLAAAMRLAHELLVQLRSDVVHPLHALAQEEVFAPLAKV